MNKRILIFVFTIILINPSLFGEENMTKITIWDTMNVWKKADPKNEKMGSYEESILIFENYDFIKNCSIEIKTIVAFYFKYLPYYITIEQKLEIVKALGNFSSLLDAQQLLLQNKEHYFKEINRSEYFWINNLTIIINGNKVMVKIGNIEEDEYLLKENSEIVFIRTTKL